MHTSRFSPGKNNGAYTYLYQATKQRPGRSSPNASASENRWTLAATIPVQYKPFETMTHKASLDKTAIIITIAVTILFAVVVVGQYSIIKDSNSATPVFTTIACLLIYFLAFVFRPINYVVTEDELIVRRPVLSVHLKRSDIQTVALLERDQIRRAIRTFGVGGLFGYYGKFANFSLGRMTWYATRRDTPVLVLTTSGKKIILTPDEPKKFVAEWNR